MKNKKDHTLLFKALSQIESEKEAATLCEDLLTPAEMEALNDRLKVIEHLKAGKSYRSIHAETGVSVTTVGRVARSLEYGSGGYDLIWNRLKKA